MGVKQSTKITVAAAGKYHTVELSRDAFNARIAPLVGQTVAKCESLLQQCDLEWDALDKVLVVGGGSKVVHVKEAWFSALLSVGRLVVAILASSLLTG